MEVALISCDFRGSAEVLHSFTELAERSSVVPEAAEAAEATEAVEASALGLTLPPVSARDLLLMSQHPPLGAG